MHTSQEIGIVQIGNGGSKEASGIFGRAISARPEDSGRGRCQAQLAAERGYGGDVEGELDMAGESFVRAQFTQAMFERAAFRRLQRQVLELFEQGVQQIRVQIAREDGDQARPGGLRGGYETLVIRIAVEIPIYG